MSKKRQILPIYDFDKPIRIVRYRGGASDIVFYSLMLALVTAAMFLILFWRNGKIVFSQASAFSSGEDFEKIVTALMGDDYAGKQIASYNFIVSNTDRSPAAGIQIRLYNDTIDETITTGDDGKASYYTEDAQDLNIELLNLPEGYTSNAGDIKVGLDSGLRMITIEKK